MVGSTLDRYVEEIAAGLGRPVPDTDVPIPLVDHIDPETATVTYSP